MEPGLVRGLIGKNKHKHYGIPIQTGTQCVFGVNKMLFAEEGGKGCQDEICVIEAL